MICPGGRRSSAVQNREDTALEGFLHLVEVAEIAAAEALMEGRHELVCQRRAKIGCDQGLFECFEVDGAGDVPSEQSPDVTRQSLASSSEAGYEPSQKPLTRRIVREHRS